MPRKRKFRPVITRIKLNPEQAVLSCDCFEMNAYATSYVEGKYSGSRVCYAYGSREFIYTEGHSTPIQIVAATAGIQAPAPTAFS